jgi:hypothetical protein
MDRAKIVLLLALFLVASSSASALFFRVEVDQNLNQTTFDLSYDNVTEEIQTVSVAVDNIGSVGCEYRLRSVQNGENFTSVEYSRSYPMWPGSSSLMQVKYAPLNYEGEINSTLFLSYCGKSTKIANFSYTISENTTVNDTFESETLRATDEEVALDLPVEKGYLVPVDAPPYWRVASTTINDGEAITSYSPPIFDEEETIEFAVVNRSTGKIMGSTTANLDPEKSLLEKARDNWLRIVLAISVLLNALLIGRRIERVRK